GAERRPRIGGMNIDFAERTAIVTGTGHGFNHAISEAFAGASAIVWACDLNADELAVTRQACGAKCEGRVVNVADRQAVAALGAEAERAGGIDILVNNAGGVLGQVGRPLEEISPADWHAIFDVNATGAFYCAQAVAPAMKRQRRGRIINISSRAG